MKFLLLLGSWSPVFYGMYAIRTLPVNFPDKFLHVLALAAMAFTLRMAFAGVRGRWLWPGLVILAVVMEFVQPLVQPLRTFSDMDVVANVAGVALGGVLWFLVTRASHPLGWQVNCHTTVASSAD